jgi:hypothetical protein
VKEKGKKEGDGYLGKEEGLIVGCFVTDSHKILAGQGLA